MYVKRDTVYADAGKMLQGKGVRAYQIKGNAEDYTEIDCPVTDITIRDGLAHWGVCAMILPKPLTYEAIKTKLVKVRYSNDDQIAIMLNGDAEDMQRMQAWRDWATDVAKAICRRMGVEC